ncbi:C6 finger domain-containing protein [Metarhizium rileyi]|uniref:C6 finger domain-containing protein n=1 Tax=Metarhizium rileyi (strain RCEF 4871) TaxID=1649241 RepID=A0A162JSG5_METRR|nr:C6 finger domain-containing protein [Metarhizium rileyi RCEF 4871]
MYQYVTDTGATIAIDDKSKGLYVNTVPRLGLTSDALLYCMYSIAALHCKVIGDLRGLVSRDAHRKYLSMGLREHNLAIANIAPKTADAICLTSSLLRFCSFILLQDRVRQPYTPPVEWLMMNASTKALVATAYELPGGGKEGSVAAMMVGFSPLVSNEEMRFDPAQRQGLEPLLQRDEVRDVREPWDAESQDAYESTLSYIGGAIETARAGDRQDGLRRLIIFPILVKGRFIELV